MDILLEGNAKRERRHLKNELKKPYSTFGRKVQWYVSEKRDKKLIKLFQDKIEDWEGTGIVDDDKLWPGIEDYKGPQFKLAFKLSIEQAIDNFEKLNDMMKKETDLILKNKNILYGKGDPPSGQEILDYREKEELKKAVLWFTEDEYPKFKVYTGKKRMHQDWKKSMTVKSWSEWVDEFFDYMSNYE